MKITSVCSHTLIDTLNQIYSLGLDHLYSGIILAAVLYLINIILFLAVSWCLKIFSKKRKSEKAGNEEKTPSKPKIKKTDRKVNVQYCPIHPLFSDYCMCDQERPSPEYTPTEAPNK